MSVIDAASRRLLHSRVGKMVLKHEALNATDQTTADDSRKVCRSSKNLHSVPR